jgi:uncharacterized protein
VTLLGLALGAYLLFAALVFAGQRLIIYPAPRKANEPRLDGGRLERIASANGPVDAFYLPASSDAPTLVHFHGNAEELADLVGLFAALHRRGLAVYAPEYPGYGLMRDRATSEPALYDAAETALGHLRERLGVPRSRTVLVGQSLGSGVAAEMAARGHGARLILISPYTSMPDMAAELVPLLPVRWLIRDRFDTLGKAERLKLPALVVHGDLDEIIPIEMGRELARTLPESRLLVVEGASHNDIFATGGPTLLDSIAAFARGS